MSISHDPQPDRELGRWERWVTNEQGERLYVEWDEEAHQAWLDKWLVRCPDGNPQRLRRVLGFRERSISELELRVPLTRGEHGACQVLLDQLEHEIHVRVLVCYDEEMDAADLHPRHYTDCPVRTWLDAPLGDRAVVDVDTDEELPLFIPAFCNSEPQPDTGYHVVNRRANRSR